MTAHQTRVLVEECVQMGSTHSHVNVLGVIVTMSHSAVHVKQVGTGGTHTPVHVKQAGTDVQGEHIHLSLCYDHMQNK